MSVIVLGGMLLAACMGAFGAEGAKRLPDAAWPQLLALPGIDVQTRRGDRVQAVIFFDPNCPVCAHLWERLYGARSAYRGMVTRWVPVSYFNAQSAGRAAALLASGSPASLALNFTEFDFARRQGAMPEVDVSPKLRSQISRNRVAWEKLGAATPAIVYARKDGTVWVQIGLLPEPGFATMLQSWREGRLAEFK